MALKFSPWPSFTQEEAEAVQKVLLSNKVNYWTGNECKAFEEEFAEHIGSAHAIAVGNGTLALELSLKALGIDNGDEVIVTPRTFIASASAIVAIGATPIFADVDAASQNITAGTIAPLISPRTRAIICVHLAGWPCEMDEICELAREHNLYVIEDCAQAHGAIYKGRHVGTLGDIAAWSFCQDKIMTTGGEGGMVTTNSESLWKKAWAYKDHGKSWDAVYEKDHPPGFRWLHESFGSNYRVTEMQAAIGRIQIKKLPDWTKARQRNADLIDQVCCEFEALRVSEIPSYISHARYKHYVFVNPDKLNPGWDRDRIISAINEEGVPCYQGSCSEIYLEKAFEDESFKPNDRLPVAEELGETSLMFLVHPTLTDIEIEKTCTVIKQVMTQASA